MVEYQHKDLNVSVPVVDDLVVEHVLVDVAVLVFWNVRGVGISGGIGPALDGGAGAGRVGAGGIARACGVEGGVGILFCLRGRAAAGGTGTSSCLVFFNAASPACSDGRFGGGGCFGCLGVSLTVVSVLGTAGSVDAFAGVSALGRFCNCSSNF